MKHKELIKHLIQGVFGAQELEIIDLFFDKLGVFRHSFGAHIGPDGVREYARAWHQAMSKPEIIITEVLQDNDKFAIRWQGEGYHQGEFNGFLASHERLSFRGLATVLMPNDKIQECHIISNIPKLLQKFKSCKTLPGPESTLVTALNQIARANLSVDEIQVLALWTWGASEQEMPLYLGNQNPIALFHELRSAVQWKFSVQDRQALFEILHHTGQLDKVLSYARLILSLKINLSQNQHFHMAG